MSLGKPITDSSNTGANSPKGSPSGMRSMSTSSPTFGDLMRDESSLLINEAVGERVWG